MQQLRISLTLLCVLALTATTALSARPPIQIQLSPDALGFDVTVPYGGASLVLQGPDGIRLQQHFTTDDLLRLELSQLDSVLPDGLYTYELRLEPAQARRDRGQSAAAELESMPIHSGHLRIEGGLAITDTRQEPGTLDAREQRPASTASDPEIQTEADQVILNELSVIGSTCVGDSCLSDETYGSDTLRLKEVNVRVHFQDTSASPYPTNDWRLIANDDTSGGGGYLAVEDSDNGYKPFTIETDSRANALYVDSTDNIGIGTATPAKLLHMISGDTPTLRLQQDGSQSFTPQSWDLGGNEVGLFVRDPASSHYPFWVRHGAPNNALVVSGTGELGLGTTTPTGDIHMIRAGVPVDIVMADSTSGRNWSLRLSGSGFAVSKASDSAAFLIFDDGRVRMGPNGTENFLLATNGNLTIAGNLTELSDVNAKHRFEDIDTAAVLENLRQLPLSTWSYRDDPDSVRHLGPTAQEFEKIFGLGNGDPTHISGMDVRGVALAAIQELAQRSEAKEHEMNDLRRSLSEVQALNEALLRRVEALEAP